MAVTVWLPLVLNFTLKVRVPALRAALVGKIALASLDPGGTEPRVAVALAPSGTPAPDDPHPTGPTISDGAHLPIAPITIHPDTQPDVDRRPVFIGAGIVLLAGVFWWNMKRRAREEDDEDQS